MKRKMHPTTSGLIAGLTAFLLFDATSAEFLIISMLGWLVTYFNNKEEDE